DLFRRYLGRGGADLGHARELQGSGRGARVHERVRALAQAERLIPDPDRGLGDPATAHADRVDLRDERAGAGRARAVLVLARPRADDRHADRPRDLVPAARLALTDGEVVPTFERALLLGTNDTIARRGPWPARSLVGGGGACTGE